MRWFLALFAVMVLGSPATARDRDMPSLIGALYDRAFPEGYRCSDDACHLRYVFESEGSSVTVKHKQTDEDKSGSIEVWVVMHIGNEKHEIRILDREARGEVDDGVDVAREVKKFASWGEYVENKSHFQDLYDHILTLLERKCRETEG